MATSRITARAKINLTLHVTGQQADGYHLLDSLVVFADQGDTITARSAPGLSLVTDGPFANAVPMDGSNLVLQAADLMLARAPVGVGASITLQKSLPPASGIGGGSADAAATLTALSRIWGIGLPPMEAVVTLGADVPVCLRGEASHMGGIGDELSPLQGLPECWAVLANPMEAVSTPAVFSALKTHNGASMPQPFPEIANIYDFAAWLAEQRNDLQDPAIRLVPVIGDVLTAIGHNPECLLTRMSGSGGTCFGLFADEAAAQRGAAALGEDHPEWWVTFTRLR